MNRRRKYEESFIQHMVAVWQSHITLWDNQEYLSEGEKQLVSLKITGGKWERQEYREMLLIMLTLKYSKIKWTGLNFGDSFWQKY